MPLQDLPTSIEDSAPEGERREDDLFAMLAAFARRISDGRLVALAAIGICGVVAVLLFFRHGWLVLALPLLSVATFGIWGISDRVIQERAALSEPPVRRHAALLGLRVVAAGVGTVAAILSLLAVAGFALGTWIS